MPNTNPCWELRYPRGVDDDRDYVPHYATRQEALDEASDCLYGDPDDPRIPEPRQLAAPCVPSPDCAECDLNLAEDLDIGVVCHFGSDAELAESAAAYDWVPSGGAWRDSAWLCHRCAPPPDLSREPTPGQSSLYVEQFHLHAEGGGRSS